jgi:large subunit ribosomal protein L28
MALKCDNCGKGILYGHNVSHAKNRTQKIFKPNLHRVKVVLGGMSKSMKLCTKCLRLVKTAMKPKVARSADADLIGAEAVVEVPQA